MKPSPVCCVVVAASILIDANLISWACICPRSDEIKKTPTSVPTTREQYRCPAFHPLQVGKAGGKLGRERWSR